VKAVRGVSLSIGRKEVLALVGESGSGKTTLGRLTVGLMRSTKGSILLDGEPLDGIPTSELWRKAQYIHQDPYGSLDPYLTVEEVLDRPIRYIRRVKSEDERRGAILGSLEEIGLDGGYLAKRIGTLSGGERQRILLARAFVSGPEYVAADEPTTMVDAVNRNEILRSLVRLKEETDASLLLITHDLSVASELADRIAIMHKGELVEVGTKDEVVGGALHPYTEALLAVTPQNLLRLGGEGEVKAPPSLEDLPDDFGGCRYVRTCPYAMDRCSVEHPELKRHQGKQLVACFKYQ
jgi:peptide/nickel transport system ATP-binding protein